MGHSASLGFQPTRAIESIAKDVHDKVFQRLREDTLTVFLVGRSTHFGSGLRSKVRKALTARPYKNRLEVYFPEEIFDELILGKSRHDLLTLENLLARSVHSVVILLESPGAIAELGAFSNHADLKDRLVVVVDEKHKKDRSFIMLGPIRYLKSEKTDSHVIFRDFENLEYPELGERVRQAVRRISNKVEIEYSLGNPIAAQHFLRALVYVMEPLHEDVLKDMFCLAARSDPSRQEDPSDAIVSGSLNIISRKKHIQKIRDRFMLTKLGYLEVQGLLSRSSGGPETIRDLDGLRVRALNLSIRRRTRDRRYLIREEV